MAALRQVAPGVLVGTSRFMTTNSVVVHVDGAALVVDPGVHVDELDALVDEVGARELTVSAGFATHAHWDHVLWHEGLGDPPRWATPATVRRARDTLADLFDQAEETTPVDRALLGDLTPLPDATVPWPGPDAIVIEHGAHQRGHAALHLPEWGVLVAGDMVSDVEIPLLDHDVAGPQALLDHLAALDRLAGLDDVDVVIPGHGTPCDAATWRDRIDADRRYLDALAGGGPRRDVRIEPGWLAAADAAMAEACTKPHWRRWVRDHVRDPADRGATVRHRLATFLGDDPGIVAAYDALPGEVDVSSLEIERRVLPRLTSTHEVTWHHDDGRYEPHRLGLRQPRAEAPIAAVTSFDAVLVPGRLFDRHGIRLGHGGGHYDRLLPRLRSDIPVIGVTVDERVVPRLPTEPHDRPMTHLATESGVRAL